MRKNIYDNIFILDGKDRSIFTILALKGTKKIIMIEKRKVNILIKILSLNKKYKIFINDKISTYKTLFNKLFKLINIELTKNDYKFLDHKSVSSLEFPSRLNINDKNYTLFHFDEKWFSELYINEYIDLDIKKDEFVNFINNFLKLNKKNIIITTGIIKIKFIEDLKDSVFKKYTENIYEYSYEGFKAILFFNSSIHDLEILSINSENIVTCNGPVTHLGNAYSVNVIDIIEKKLEHWYDRHISNTENYNKLYRKKFNELSLEILNKIK